MHRREFLALSAASLVASHARAATDAKWPQSLADYISSQLTATHTPGVGVAMVKGAYTAFAHGYGYAEVEKASRVTPDTIFQIASVSKTVTATALMLLWEGGALRGAGPWQESTPGEPWRCSRHIFFLPAPDGIGGADPIFRLRNAWSR